MKRRECGEKATNMKCGEQFWVNLNHKIPFHQAPKPHIINLKDQTDLEGYACLH